MRKLVLVVDDSATMRRAVELLFLASEYDVAAASTADEVERALGGRVPSVALVDAGLPGGAGFALAVALKAHPATSETPVLLLASATTDAAALEAADVDGYVLKPFGAEELLDPVRMLTGDLVRRDVPLSFAEQLRAERGQLAPPLARVPRHAGESVAAPPPAVAPGARSEPTPAERPDSTVSSDDLAFAALPTLTTRAFERAEPEEIFDLPTDAGARAIPAPIEALEPAPSPVVVSAATDEAAPSGVAGASVEPPPAQIAGAARPPREAVGVDVAPAPLLALGAPAPSGDRPGLDDGLLPAPDAPPRAAADDPTRPSADEPPPAAGAPGAAEVRPTPAEPRPLALAAAERAPSTPRGPRPSPWVVVLLLVLAAGGLLFALALLAR